MNSTPITVTSILANDVGGITSMIGNVIRYRGDAALPQEIIFFDKKEKDISKFYGTLVDGISQKTYHFSQNENWYHAFSRLSSMLPPGNGVIVSNDVYDLLMLSRFNTGKKVVQIVHDAYNISLSLQYSDVIDAFICHSYFYYEVLCQLLSKRRKDIYHLPYGVLLTEYCRQENTNSPLKCLFLGRLHIDKGIYDLYKIDSYLREINIYVQWTIVGRGTEEKSLKEQWNDKENVDFVSPENSSEVLRICAANDVLVFPTKFEGFPVAMVESMSVGCVPVVSDLPGGIRELVTEDTGYLCSLDHSEEFARKIAFLHHNRQELERKSNQAKTLVHQNYDALIQSPKYQALFKKIALLDDAPRHHQVNIKIGSRLDQPWIPNILTKKLRSIDLSGI